MLSYDEADTVCLGGSDEAPHFAGSSMSEGDFGEPFSPVLPGRNRADGGEKQIFQVRVSNFSWSSSQ